MATGEQIKTLIRSHFDRDGERFKTTALQIAAYEAKQGHEILAREIKQAIERTPTSHFRTIQSESPQNKSLLMVFPDNKLQDLITTEEIHERLERITTEYFNRKKLQKHGIYNRRKILIEGPPGTGKTLTASIIASELGLPLFTVQMDKLVTKFMGETSVKLRQIFDSVENSLGVYFFDEFDAIGADRGIDNEVGEMRRVLNSFLQMLEQDTSDSLIIAATNKQNILDKALFRRFDDVLHYSLPSTKDIQKLFIAKLNVYQPAFYPSNEIIEKASTLNHAEITRICTDAIKSAILTDKPIEQKLLLNLIDERLLIYTEKRA